MSTVGPPAPMSIGPTNGPRSWNTCVCLHRQNTLTVKVYSLHSDSPNTRTHSHTLANFRRRSSGLRSCERHKRSKQVTNYERANYYHLTVRCTCRMKDKSLPEADSAKRKADDSRRSQVIRHFARVSSSSYHAAYKCRALRGMRSLAFESEWRAGVA